MPKLNPRSLLRRFPPAVWLYNQAKSTVAQRAFKRDFDRFSTLSQSGANRFEIRWADRYPCLTDKTSTTLFDRHYIYHPAWAARILSQTRPKSHVDVASKLYFATMVSA